MHKAYFELVVYGILISLNHGQCDLIASCFLYTDLKKKKKGNKVFKIDFLFLLDQVQNSFLPEGVNEGETWNQIKVTS